MHSLRRHAPGRALPRFPHVFPAAFHGRRCREGAAPAQHADSERGRHFKFGCLVHPRPRQVFPAPQAQLRQPLPSSEPGKVLDQATLVSAPWGSDREQDSVEAVLLDQKIGHCPDCRSQDLCGGRGPALLRTGGRFASHRAMAQCCITACSESFSRSSTALILAACLRISRRFDPPGA